MKILTTMSLLLAAAPLAMPAFAKDTVTSKPWGKTPDGKRVSLYTLTNAKGAHATITTYGGIVTTLYVPDKSGKLGDIVLGYDNLKGYITNVGNPYFGAIIGRYGNRIAKGKFTLDGKTYTLAINNPPNHLHGGNKGFDKVVWMGSPVRAKGGAGVALSYLSKDGEEGYPGNLKVKVVYTLTDDNSLKVEYTATTDKDTVVNLTHHSYFNLDGAGKGDILGTKLTIAADKYTPIDVTAIPTGELASVAGTPFDFRTPVPIGKRINDKNEQLKNGNGYDHNFVLDGTGLRKVAETVASTSGRVMDVWTTEPGLQFYTSNYLDGSAIGKGRMPYKRRYAFCLEAQDFPDSPNEASFPSAELKPGETYTQTTVYKFRAK